MHLQGAILTPNGLFLMGIPAKKIFTECKPTKFETYSHLQRFGSIWRTFTGTVVL